MLEFGPNQIKIKRYRYNSLVISEARGQLPSLLLIFWIILIFHHQYSYIANATIEIYLLILYKLKADSNLF